MLFTINAFMDDSGTCFPSQEEIAAAACMGVSTVRRKIAKVSRSHWLAIEARTAYGGRRWKHYAYRACAPDELVNAFEPENSGVSGPSLADAWEAQHGAITAESLAGTMFPQPGLRRAPPAASGSQAKAPPGASGSQAKAPPGASGGRQKITHSVSRAPPADDTSTARPRAEHRPLTTRAPPAVGYEVPILSSKEKLQGEGAAVAAPPGASGSQAKADMGHKIRKLHNAGHQPAEIVGFLKGWGYGITLEDVRRETGT